LNEALRLSQRSLRILQMRLEEAEAALEHGRRAAAAGAAEVGGGDAALRRPAGMQVLRLGAVDPALEQAGGEAADDAEGTAELGGIEPEHPAGEAGGAERREQPGRMEAAAVEPARRHAADPAGDLVAHGNRGDQLPARAGPGLGQRQGSGDRRAAHVDDRFVVGVVVLHGLGQRAVGEGGRGDRDPLAGAEQSAGALGAHRQRRRAHRLPEVGAEPRQGEADHVQCPVLRRLHDVARQILVAGRERPARERGGTAGHGHSILSGSQATTSGKP